jgi:2-polyprenyl-6-methoxyphenol hydroxylase-like FAD-dependent oxidoreductase
MTQLKPTYDVIVIGARCAGASTALLLARAGRRVLLVERAAEGSDTMSTHALMRPAVHQLQRWGLLDRVRAVSPAVRTTTFYYGGEGDVGVPIIPRDGVDALYAPRRTYLDAILVQAAREAGATVRHGVRLEGVLRDARGRVQGAVLHDAHGAQVVHADLVIGADGVRSTVATVVGAEVYRRAEHSTTTVYGYFPAPEVAGYHWYFDARGLAVGLIPTSDDLVCVFASAAADRFEADVKPDPGAFLRRVVGDCAPEHAARLAGLPLRGAARTFPGLRGFLRASAGPGWALVGDAGYFRDPITAHGITDALRDAELLARAVLTGSEAALLAYPDERDALCRRHFEISDAVASMRWSHDEVMRLHLEMSRDMARELDALRALETPTVRAA